MSLKIYIILMLLLSVITLIIYFLKRSLWLIDKQKINFDRVSKFFNYIIKNHIVLSIYIFTFIPNFLIRKKERFNPYLLVLRDITEFGILFNFITKDKLFFYSNPIYTALLNFERNYNKGIDLSEFKKFEEYIQSFTTYIMNSEYIKNKDSFLKKLDICKEELCTIGNSKEFEKEVCKQTEILKKIYSQTMEVSKNENE